MQRSILIILSMVVIVSGCSKKQIQLNPRHMTPEQLEQEHSKYKTRGITLTTTGSIITAGAAGVGGFFGMMTTGGEGIAFCACVTAAICGGIYTIVQGAHNLAKAKKIRRMQMKEATYQRKLEREQQLQAI